MRLFFKTYDSETQEEDGVIWELIQDLDNGKETQTITPLDDVQVLVDIGEAKLYDSDTEARASVVYQANRQREYPSIQDQLDYIYHNSITKWKSDMIKPVKDKHPKP